MGSDVPSFPGALIDLGGHKIHLNCYGAGSPTVVIETGFQEFSVDWSLVQPPVSQFTRVCTYDRAGYAWSDPGPLPRSNAQVNLELHDALLKAGERAPFVLVGHSYGGPVVRTYAAVYPSEVAGMVLAEATHEDDRYSYGGRSYFIRSGATGKNVPEPHETMLPSDLAYYATASPAPTVRAVKVDPPFDRLSPTDQIAHAWAASLGKLSKTEDSERTWSPEAMQHLHETNQTNVLHGIPLVVLSRAVAGFGSTDIAADKLDADWRDNQNKLAALSTDSIHRWVRSGHEIEVEDPSDVVDAIHAVVLAVRTGRKVAQLCGVNCP